MFTGKGREEVPIEALNFVPTGIPKKGGDLRSRYRVLEQEIEQEIDHYKMKKQNKNIRKELDEKFNTIKHPFNRK